MKKHLEDLLDNALKMYDEEVLKNIQLKKQYEIMKMNAEYLIEKNDELNKKIKDQDEEIERQNEVINGMIDNEEKYCLENNKINNTINELEKFLEEERKKDRQRSDYNYGVSNAFDYIWYKLQELKGSDKK